MKTTEKKRRIEDEEIYRDLETLKILRKKTQLTKPQIEPLMARRINISSYLLTDSEIEQKLKIKSEYDKIRRCQKMTNSGTGRPSVQRNSNEVGENGDLEGTSAVKSQSSKGKISQGQLSEEIPKVLSTDEEIHSSYDEMTNIEFNWLLCLLYLLFPSLSLFATNNPDPAYQHDQPERYPKQKIFDCMLHFATYSIMFVKWIIVENFLAVNRVAKENWRKAWS